MIPLPDAILKILFVRTDYPGVYSTLDLTNFLDI
jgi:hypothetical protein